MDHSVTFARHYARLLALLMHEASNVDEQKATLRALVTVSKDGAVEISATGEALTVNGTPVPNALSGVVDVQSRMLAHGVSAVAFDLGAAAAGMLGSARILAGDAVAGDGGTSAVTKLQALNAPSVRFAVRPVRAEPVRGPAPVPASPSAATTAPIESVASATRAPTPSRTEPGMLPDFGFGDVEVLDEELVQAKLRPTPRANVAIPSNAESHSESGGGMFEQFAATRAPSASHTELLAQLDQATGATVLTRVLDDLVAIAEAASRDARPALVCEILCRVTRREPQVHDSRRSVRS